MHGNYKEQTIKKNNHTGYCKKYYRVGCSMQFTRIYNKNLLNLRKIKIYLLTSCNTEERIAQNIRYCRRSRGRS